MHSRNPRFYFFLQTPLETALSHKMLPVATYYFTPVTYLRFCRQGNQWRWRMANECVADTWPEAIHRCNILSTWRQSWPSRICNHLEHDLRSGLLYIITVSLRKKLTISLAAILKNLNTGTSILLLLLCLSPSWWGFLWESAVVQVHGAFLWVFANVY